jgi:hypothetical protein
MLTSILVRKGAGLNFTRNINRLPTLKIGHRLPLLARLVLLIVPSRDVRACLIILLPMSRVA